MFHIATYCLAPYARSEKHIRELCACGIDTVLSFPAEDRATLDLFQKYGISAFVTGVVPSWWGGHGEKAGTMAETNPISAYENAPFEPHEAIAGIDIGDEPSLLDFDHYGAVIRCLQKRFPTLVPYLNLYPNYGVLASCSAEEAEKQLSGSYGEYIDEYLKKCPLPYLSFDHYPYSSDMGRYFENLEKVSRACIWKGIPMSIVLQVNSIDENMPMTLNMLRFQAFTALCYGARSIAWACYTAGWWHHQVLDESGEKTPRYAYLQTVNRETRFLAEKLESLTWNGSARDLFSNSVFTDCSGSCLIGDYGTALLLVRMDDPYDREETEGTFSFYCEKKQLFVLTDGTESVLYPDIAGSYTLTLRSNHAALVIAEE